jgi:predicted amidophosphoribosyltransferase
MRALLIVLVIILLAWMSLRSARRCPHARMMWREGVFCPRCGAAHVRIDGMCMMCGRSVDK